MYMCDQFLGTRIWRLEWHRQRFSEIGEHNAGFGTFMDVESNKVEFNI